jgi:hypothetical protein
MLPWVGENNYGNRDGARNNSGNNNYQQPAEAMMARAAAAVVVVGAAAAAPAAGGDAGDMADQFSFEDSDRFEEDSMCSWISEPESVVNNWRGWRKSSVTASTATSVAPAAPAGLGGSLLAQAYGGGGGVMGFGSLLSSGINNSGKESGMYPVYFKSFTS